MPTKFRSLGITARSAKRLLLRGLPIMAAASGVLWLTCGATGNVFTHSTLVPENSKSRQCDEHDLSQFEMVANHSVKHEVSEIPAGVLIYSSAEMLVSVQTEKGQTDKGKGECTRTTQILVRETPSKTPLDSSISSQVVCTSRPSKVTVPIDVSLLGLTLIRSDGSGQTSIRTRQFQTFVNENGQGIVNLNPRLHARPMNTLTDYLAAMGSEAQLFRLEDQTYVLKLERETNGVHSRMLIKYDFIPRG